MDVNYQFTQTIAHWGIRGNNYAKVGVALRGHTNSVSEIQILTLARHGGECQASLGYKV